MTVSTLLETIQQHSKKPGSPPETEPMSHESVPSIRPHIHPFMKKRAQAKKRAVPSADGTSERGGTTNPFHRGDEIPAGKNGGK